MFLFIFKIFHFLFSYRLYNGVSKKSMVFRTFFRFCILIIKRPAQFELVFYIRVYAYLVFYKFHLLVQELMIFLVSDILQYLYHYLHKLVQYLPAHQKDAPHFCGENLSNFQAFACSFKIFTISVLTCANYFLVL